MSLQEPEKKMSKSDPNVNGFISILDGPDVILRKFKRAITDSEARVAYEEGRSAINNLMGIYSCCTGKSMEQIEAEFEGRGYGDFKTAVAEAVIEELRPVQERFDSYMKSPDYLRDCAAKGAESAQRISQRTLDKVMKRSVLCSNNAEMGRPFVCRFRAGPSLRTPSQTSKNRIAQLIQTEPGIMRWHDPGPLTCLFHLSNTKPDHPSARRCR